MNFVPLALYAVAFGFYGLTLLRLSESREFGKVLMRPLL